MDNSNEKTNETKLIQTLKFRVSLRMNYVLFPIDGRELIEALAQAGYKTQPFAPFGARQRLTLSGQFAQKGNVAIDGNSDRGTLGVTSTSPDEAIEALNEMASLLKKNLQIDVEEGSRFFEIIADYKIISCEKPIFAISKIFEKNRVLQEIGEILGQQTSLYTLRLVPANMEPNQEEWLDITIEPDVTKPNSRYLISVVFRSKKRETVERFGKELESKLTTILNLIEETK